MRVNKIILAIIIACCQVTAAFAVFQKTHLPYTVVPNMAYLAHIEKSSQNGYTTLEGFLPVLIEEIAEDLNLKAQAIPFDTPEKALNMAEQGTSETFNALDMIGGVYYNNRTANYMTYITPALMEDPILVVFPSKINASIKTPKDFQKIEDMNKRAVIIKGIPLGTWFDNIQKDRNGNWEKLVYQKKEKNAIPLKVDEVKNIDEAIQRVIAGTHYFIGSNLMIKDYIKRHPEHLGKVNGRYIYVNNEAVKKSIFIAVNNDFLDVFESLNIVEKLQKKITEMKLNGELDRRITEHKKRFWNKAN